MKRGTCSLTLMLLLALIICTIGCAEKEPKPSPTPTPTVALSITPATTQTSSATPTPAPSTTMALFLEITQPQDGAEVSASTIVVSGKTIAGAVVSVSIDDTVEIANIDQDGNFSVTVNLEEGPNIIEVVASDQLGNEKSSSIAVIYVP